MIMQTESLKSTGPTSTGSEISANAELTISDESTLFAAGSPVRTFPTPDGGQDLTENDQDCFSKPFAWFANYDPESLCWKTWQRCLLGDWIEFSGRWPRSGMMRNGIAYRLPPLVPRISGTGCLLWPTPAAQESSPTEEFIEEMKGSIKGTHERLYLPGRKHHTQTTLSRAVHTWPTPVSCSKAGGRCGLDGGSGARKVLREQHGEETMRQMTSGQLNPQWVEWLMGFPLGWTDCEDSETP